MVPSGFKNIVADSPTINVGAVFYEPDTASDSAPASLVGRDLCVADGVAAVRLRSPKPAPGFWQAASPVQRPSSPQSSQDCIILAVLDALICPFSGVIPIQRNCFEQGF